MAYLSGVGAFLLSGPIPRRTVNNGNSCQTLWKTFDNCICLLIDCCSKTNCMKFAKTIIAFALLHLQVHIRLKPADLVAATVKG
jgi:hypothetical protein